MPQRLQRSRTRDFRMPDGAIYVGRGQGAYGKWGNPYRVTPGGLTATVAVQLYTELLASSPNLRALARQELAGRDLVCWCPLGQPCHADVLLAIANGGC